MPQQEYHQFDNLIRIARDYLEAPQLQRYGNGEGPNLHEPEEESWFTTLVERCGADEDLVFLDIGAAVGYYSVLVRKLRPDAKIIAVDANLRFQEAFWNTLAENNIANDGVELRHVAVYPHKQEVQLADKHFGSHVQQAHNAAVPEAQLRSVPAVDLPALVSGIGGSISICKLDVQTAELPILLHALPRLSGELVKRWIIGTHGPTIHARLLELFAECGWQVIHDNPNPSFQPDGIIVAVSDSR